MSEKTTGKLYTKGEEIFNAVSHGLGALLGIVGTTVLVMLGVQRQSLLTVVTCLIYGITLITLYTMSAVYHSIPMQGAKRILRIFDHSTIYLLIAGSYTPLTLLLLPGSKKAQLVCGVVWAAAIIGILLNCIDLKKFLIPSVAMYIAMGWAVVFVIGDVTAALQGTGFQLLLWGGISYTFGVTFYVLRKVYPKWHYTHGVFHIFILLGSVLHYFCILNYVLPLV